MIEWWGIAVGLMLTVGTGVFVASEFSLVSLDRADLDARRRRGERGLGVVRDALAKTATHLSSAQLGITLTTLLAGFAFEPAISGLFRPLFGSLGAENLTGPLSSVSAVATATIVSMVLGELIPKNLALALPVATARWVAPVQIAFSALFRPAIWALNGTANAVLRLGGIEPKEELSAARSAEELASLVRRSASAGALEADTATLLDRTLRFSQLSAADVMTPRPRVESVDQSDTALAIIELAEKTGLSRFPVTGEDIDDIVGVVHLKHAVAVPRTKRNEVRARALKSEPLRVPDTMGLEVLLGELRIRGYQLAIVVDEYGGTAGVATLEDLVEELVGDVSDEHDRRRPGLVQRGNSFSFPGLWRPDEVREGFGLEIPEGSHYETVAGYVMARLGRIPNVGDRVTVTGGELEVVGLDGRRIDRLRYRPELPAESSGS